MSPFFNATLCIAFLLASSQMSGADEVQELRTKAKELKLRAAEIAQNGHHEDAERLRQESTELTLMADHLASKNESGKDRQPDGEIAQLKERLHDLRVALERAELDGRSETEQNEIREQSRNIERKLHQVRERRDRRDGDGLPPIHVQAERLEHLSRRIHHMRKAAENLKAAELHDLAFDLTHKAEALERDLRAAKLELAHAESGSIKERESDEAVRQAKAENEKLRQELNELREAVQQLKKERE